MWVRIVDEKCGQGLRLLGAERGLNYGSKSTLISSRLYFTLLDELKSTISQVKVFIHVKNNAEPDLKFGLCFLRAQFRSTVENLWFSWGHSFKRKSK